MQPKGPGKEPGAQIAVSARILRRAVEAAGDGVVITDPRLPDNPIVYVNPAFERITGYPLGEAMGRNCRFLQGPEDAGQRSLDEVREALKEERECRVVVRNRRKDGEAFWHELRIYPVLGDGGKTEHFVGLQTDVTERVRARESARQRELDIAALAEERTRVGLALHDLIAHSMAVVRQHLELHEVLSGRDPEAARERLVLAKEQAKVSLQTARDLSMSLRLPPRRPT